MQLSAEQFKEIIGHLISDLSGKSIEKRREPRVGVRFEAMVTIVTTGEPDRQDRILIRDLSRSGINILSHNQMQQGSQFRMTMPHANNLEMAALYKICHCKPIGGTMYAVGATLLSISNKAKTVAA